MDNIVFLIDFGSTFTKIIAVDMDREEVLSRAQSPSTVQDNILFGFQRALKKLTIQGKHIDENSIKNSRKFACSSAAGGLGLVTIGLVPELTLEAAKRAALGAGAKVIGSFAHELNDDDVYKIGHSGCDIIVISGGTDGGNKNVILHNAKMLAKSYLNVPIIIAGNRVVSNQVNKILESEGKYALITENVLPDLYSINVEPVRSCIRDVFMKRIVHAKGLNKAQEYVGNILMPTPMATLKASQLLAEGTDTEPGIGELMVVEVGGATTNVHSVARGYNSERFVKGLPEPYAKRTVEGDLGIRYNASTILDIVGEQKMLEYIPNKVDCTKLDLAKTTNFLCNNVEFEPLKEHDFLIDLCLACSAVEVAVERHVGFVKEAWGPQGIEDVQYGKDLTEIQTLIGTGGIFHYNHEAQRILEAALFNQRNPFSLKPKSPNFYIDRAYILYGIGLLSDIEPDIALRIAKKYMSTVKT